MKEEFEHQNTSEIVCPYCGKVHQDSWEYQYSEDVIECESCYKKFKYTRDIIVSYTTEKIK